MESRETLAISLGLGVQNVATFRKLDTIGWLNGLDTINNIYDKH